MNWTIRFYNDMGHLLIDDFDKIPDQVRKFALDKISNKINHAKDNKNLGCRFYILRSGLDLQWTYNLPTGKITLDFSQLDKFDPTTMIYV